MTLREARLTGGESNCTTNKYSVLPCCVELGLAGAFFRGSHRVGHCRRAIIEGDGLRVSGSVAWGIAGKAACCGEARTLCHARHSRCALYRRSGPQRTGPDPTKARARRCRAIIAHRVAQKQPHQQQQGHRHARANQRKGCSPERQSDCQHHACRNIPEKRSDQHGTNEHQPPLCKPTSDTTLRCNMPTVLHVCHLQVDAVLHFRRNDGIFRSFVRFARHVGRVFHWRSAQIGLCRRFPLQPAAPPLNPHCMRARI